MGLLSLLGRSDAPTISRRLVPIRFLNIAMLLKRAQITRASRRFLMTFGVLALHLLHLSLSLRLVHALTHQHIH
jgi:hypothetical protein